MNSAKIQGIDFQNGDMQSIRSHLIAEVAYGYGTKQGRAGSLRAAWLLAEAEVDAMLEKEQAVRLAHN